MSANCGASSCISVSSDEAYNVNIVVKQRSFVLPFLKISGVDFTEIADWTVSKPGKDSERDTKFWIRIP